MIPTVWQFQPNAGGDPVPVPGEIDRNNYAIYVDGAFVPDLTQLKPVTELINPAGPIGYAGNYAIYYLQADDISSDTELSRIFDILSVLKFPYTNYPNEQGKRVDPTIPETDFLDPTMRQVMKEVGKIPRVISQKERIEMIQTVPYLRAKVEAMAEADQVKFLKAKNTEYAPYYYQYKFRKQYTRQVLIDTNNLLVDIEPGLGSALEEFKQKHRKIDVDKANEERIKLHLENVRRSKLITKKKFYGDPDIDKVITVTDPKTLSSVLDMNFDDEEETEADADN